VALEDEGEREGAVKLRQHRLHRLHRAEALGEMGVDQMRDHLGIGLARKRHAVLLELRAQLAEILDDAVVHHRDIVGGVRMRVGLRRLAVRRPAGVADAGMAGERRRLQQRLEILQLAFCAAAVEPRAFQRRDAGGIVSAILSRLRESTSWSATGPRPRIPTIPHMRP